MSVQALSWVLDHSEAEHGCRLVLIAIANHAKQDGTGAWPSIATIAQESRLSERGVRDALRDLEELGELATEVGMGPHGCNLYVLQKMPGANSAGGTLQQAGGQNSAETATKIAPEPSVREPSKNRPSVEPNFVRFQKAFKQAAGKTPKPFESLVDRYGSLARRYGETDLLDAINEWVENKGGRKLTRKNDYAARNFLMDDAEDILDAHIDERNEQASRGTGELPQLARPER